LTDLKDSRLAEVVQLFQRKGLRRGLAAVGSKIARRYSRNFVQLPEYLEGTLAEEAPAQLKPSTSGPLRINWILPGIAFGHGGFINIFRTIQQLEISGHENRVYLSGNLRGGSAAVKERIRKAYFPITVEVEPLRPKIRDCDALIATAWPTAYAARSIGNTAAKFYFVQDLEYMFYAPGSFYEFARQTYHFGFRGLTAGPWIADLLRREFNMECSSFGFSYDRDLYADTGPHLFPDGKKRLLFYARPETERRGFELGALALALVAKRLPGVEIVLAGVPARSVDLPFPATCVGVLPLSRLGALYRSCDVALVLSHTNISLLPLELMACGCAVISNHGPNVDWLLSRETAQLAEANPRSIAEAIAELFGSDQLRGQKIEAGLALARSTDWTKEIQTIESAILRTRENSPRLHQYA